MAKDVSFDIVSKVDMQEVDNAINQTKKEIAQRYDFKGSKTEIDINKNEIKIISDSEFHLQSVIDILQSKMIKRGISIKSLSYGKVENGTSNTIRQIITIIVGIDKEKGKDIIAYIKKLSVKVQAQIMEEQLRVSGKNKDDLQIVIQELKNNDFGLDLQFVNYR